MNGAGYAIVGAAALVGGGITWFEFHSIPWALLAAVAAAFWPFVVIQRLGS